MADTRHMTCMYEVSTMGNRDMLEVCDRCGSLSKHCDLRIMKIGDSDAHLCQKCFKFYAGYSYGTS